MPCPRCTLIRKSINVAAIDQEPNATLVITCREGIPNYKTGEESCTANIVLTGTPETLTQEPSITRFGGKRPTPQPAPTYQTSEKNGRSFYQHRREVMDQYSVSAYLAEQMIANGG